MGFWLSIFRLGRQPQFAVRHDRVVGEERILADRQAAEAWSGIPERTIRDSLEPVACEVRRRRMLYDLAAVEKLRDTSTRRPRRKRAA